ncbi:MAG: dihydroorotate dehydrogenase-like protein [Fimbriimonadales bacterium]
MDLRTKYLGLRLNHPFVASASPLSKTLDGIKRLEDGGASAIVLFSLFEEQLRYENEAYDFLTRYGSDSSAEALSYFPAMSDYKVGPDAYLELIRKATEATHIPIIGSLNGVTDTGWTEYARDMQEAGAEAIELNVYSIPADLSLTGRDVEEMVLDVAKAVSSSVDIPVAMKLSPFFSAFGDMAKRVCDTGIAGLVLFNRFYQPDFDLDKLEVVPSLELSTSAEMRLPLLWIALLYGRLPVSLAATTGVHTGADAVKYVMAGADAVMATSALLQHGASHLRTMLDGMKEWMERQGYDSVEQMRGSMSQAKVADPNAFERANYLKTLQSYVPTFH